MTTCAHQRIRSSELLEEDMHCCGWTCQSCDYSAIGECHHRSWCREDFCGAQPMLAETSEPVLALA